MLEANKNYRKEYIRGLQLQKAKYITIKQRLTNFDTFLADHADKDILTLSARELEDYVISKGQPEHLVRAIKKFYSMMDRSDITRRILLKRVQRDIKTGDLLTEDEVKRLMEAAGRRDRAIIALLWDTGIRPEELLTMRMNSVDFHGEVAHISVTGKTGSRTIPLQDETTRELLEYVDATPRLGDGLFWARHDGGEGRISDEGLRLMLRKVAKKAGIKKKIYPYLFRHSALTRDAALGYTEIELCLKAGWRLGSRMPSVYIHLGSTVLDAKVKVLGRNPAEMQALAAKIESLESQVSALASIILEQKNSRSQSRTGTSAE